MGEKPSAEVMMMKSLNARGQLTPPLSPADVCYWHGDVF
jgi:hypothetical protein